MIRMVGLDPGATTGLVALEVPESLQLLTARWIQHREVRPSSSAGFLAAGRDVDFHRRLLQALTELRPHVLVLEEPFDAQVTWRGYGKQQRGTAFRVGAAYGLAIAAAAHVGPPLPAVYSYPVRDQKGIKEAPARKGWMSGIAGGNRDKAIGGVVALARHLSAPTSLFEVNGKGEYRHQDCLMALGVLAFHCGQHRPTSLVGQRPVEAIA